MQNSRSSMRLKNKQKMKQCCNINWTQKNKNCRTISQLYKGCIKKQGKCDVYNAILTKCTITEQVYPHQSNKARLTGQRHSER